MLDAFAQPTEAYQACFLTAAGALVLSVLTLPLVEKKPSAAQLVASDLGALSFCDSAPIDRTV